MQSKGVELIAAERQRQVEVEDWTSQHDVQHKNGELALAAAVYAVPNHLRGILMVLWPWAPEWYKPKDRIRDLVRAGALIAAEIDRLLLSEGGADGATMTDLERAQVIDADPDGSLRVSATQHGLRIEYRRCYGAQCQVSIPWSEIDRHRGIPLTLEDVQTIILDVANEHGQPPGYPSHLHFAMDVLARLRQKMGGGQR